MLKTPPRLAQDSRENPLPRPQWQSREAGSCLGAIQSVPCPGAIAAFHRRLKTNRLKASRRLSAFGPEADQQLAVRLEAHGFVETKASVTNKLARATMTAHFFLASLAAIGRVGIMLAEI